jgi:hypothetical protein
VRAQVYVVYFKTNRNFLHEMPHLRGYVCDLYATPGIAASVNMRCVARGLWRPRLRAAGSALQGAVLSVPCTHTHVCVCAQTHTLLPHPPPPSPHTHTTPKHTHTRTHTHTHTNTPNSHIKTHYFTSHPALNTYAIIPSGGAAWWEDKALARERRARFPHAAQPWDDE